MEHVHPVCRVAKEESGANPISSTLAIANLPLANAEGLGTPGDFRPQQGGCSGSWISAVHHPSV